MDQGKVDAFVERLFAELNAGMSGYAREAGFTRVEDLPIENAQFRFYRLTP